ncbi:MAG: apolipoprotein N-acyltransferase, partial [Candidatus Omnitrophota bacterium]
FKKMRNLASSTEEDSLVIFPEAAWPAIVNDDNFFEFKSFFDEINRDTLVGAVTERDGKFYNTALLLDKEGECLTLYNKVKLVPFGEYVPFRKLLKFIGVLNSLGDITPGSQLTRFTYRGKHFSVMICFEDIFPLQVRRVSRNSDFLVNITNDAWFRSQSEANQHLSIMTLRAVENRISIIRSSNTGISAKVSFNGQIEELKDKNKNIFFSGQKSFNIILSNHRSFYNTHGEIFPVFCLAVIIITALAGFLKRRRISLDANH